jgi:hypothetical protein
MAIMKPKDGGPKGMSKPSKFGGSNPLGRSSKPQDKSVVMSKSSTPTVSANATGRSKMVGLEKSYKNSGGVKLGVTGGAPTMSSRMIPSTGGINMSPKMGAMSNVKKGGKPTPGAKSYFDVPSANQSIDKGKHDNLDAKAGVKSLKIAGLVSLGTTAAGLMLKKKNRQALAKGVKKIIKAPRNLVESIKENREFKKGQKKIAAEKKVEGGSVKNASENTKKFIKKGK